MENITIPTPEFNQPESALQTKPKKNYLAILLICLTFIIFIAGAYYLGKQSTVVLPKTTIIPTTTVDPNSNWKTYINTKYGFELSYPNNWQMKEVNNIETFEVPVNNISITNPSNNIQLVFGIRKNNEKIRTTFRTGVGGGKTIISKSINFYDQTINRYVMKEGDRCDEAYYTKSSNLPQEFVIGNYSFVIDINNINSDYSICSAPELDTIDQILSTFKFTEQ